MNHEIQHILSRTQQISHGAIIQTIIDYLGRSQTTSTLAKESKHDKSEETKDLIKFIEENKFWVKDLNLNNYVSEGAEQKVYLKDDKTVLKLNDSIYYISWKDYLVNLLLNNYFFPDTAYNLKGFFETNSIVYAVVEQSFVKANQETDLESVRQFLESNGFINTRNNDYYNNKLGIILEDLHDENVLTQNDVLYFIDTVFYITNRN
jgi:parallel beta-helix repeat protein